MSYCICDDSITLAFMGLYAVFLSWNYWPRKAFTKAEFIKFMTSKTWKFKGFSAAYWTKFADDHINLVTHTGEFFMVNHITHTEQSMIKGTKEWIAKKMYEKLVLLPLLKTASYPLIVLKPTGALLEFDHTAHDDTVDYKEGAATKDLPLTRDVCPKKGFFAIVRYRSFRDFCEIFILADDDDAMHYKALSIASTTVVPCTRRIFVPVLPTVAAFFLVGLRFFLLCTM